MMLIINIVVHLCILAYSAYAALMKISLKRKKNALMTRNVHDDSRFKATFNCPVVNTFMSHFLKIALNLVTNDVIYLIAIIPFFHITPF